MTEMKCSVSTCNHNCGSLCALNSVEVAGASACKNDETCCNSFTQKLDSVTNSVNRTDVRPETKIKCQAAECKYNKSAMCNADSVQISGHGADYSHDTQCTTFSAR